jgi:CheY-like chemotaxis protein
MTDTALSAPDTSARARLGPELPFLRRYARALSGNQSTGDAWVRATLEALLEAPEALNGKAPARLELFRLFHAFWSPHAALARPREEGEPAPPTLGEASLDAMPRSQREALLLTAVEGFSLAEAAVILGRAADEVAADADAARAAMAAAMRCRVLIIEDEPLIAMHLETIVADMGHEAVGIATTHREAVALADAEQPDLVLADVQLADGSSGIEAVAEILETMEAPVVFITAYPERLLTGERPEPTWLVTKPFEAGTVTATVGQALLLRKNTAEPA